MERRDQDIEDLYKRLRKKHKNEFKHELKFKSTLDDFEWYMEVRARWHQEEKREMQKLHERWAKEEIRRMRRQ